MHFKIVYVINKRVASDLITLVDFAHTAFGKPAPLPVYLDDEGTLAEDAVIIKDGILTGYMNNRETAVHFGIKPQGNARAWKKLSRKAFLFRITQFHKK